MIYTFFYPFLLRLWNKLHIFSQCIGPVCGPSNIENPITFSSYCDMLRQLCRGVGGPENVPRQSPIEAEKGPCEPGDGQGGGNPNPNPTPCK